MDACTTLNKHKKQLGQPCLVNTPSQALSAPPVVKREAQRSTPLTADERGQMLGEVPLPQQSTDEALPPPPDRKVPLMKIADADRQRIRQALGGSFVRCVGCCSVISEGVIVWRCGINGQRINNGQRIITGLRTVMQQEAAQHPCSQDSAQVHRPRCHRQPSMLQQPSSPPCLTDLQAAALRKRPLAVRCSYAHIARQPPAVYTHDAAARDCQPCSALTSLKQRLITSVPTEGLQQAPPTVTPPKHASGGVQRPVRHVEPWRPVPLLCKRLNVADPYKGKAAEAEVWQIHKCLNVDQHFYQYTSVHLDHTGV